MSVRSTLLPVIGLFCSLFPLAGQEARGTLLGRVFDPTDAVIAGAKVDAVNVETGVHYTSTSNGSGDYILPFLMPGNYTLTVENKGFKNYTRAAIAIRQSDRVTIDVKMEVGDATQSVQVSTEAPILDTSTASMGQVISSQSIADLPTKDGMVLVLATLSPGVIFTPENAAYIRPFDTSSPSTMSINGTRNGSNEFMVDGASNMQGTQIAYSPPQAVVGEFKVQTSTFDAAFGFMPGAAVNMTLKSGTNSLHGQASYILQNPALNSDNFFRLAAGKPQNRVHRTSDSLTGPLYIPKVYDGRNKSFFTLGFEWIYSFDPSPWVVESVPTAAERRGDFSSLLAIGPQYQIYDPYSTKPASGGQFTRQPLVGNIVPQSRISPVAANLVKYWDPPNQAGTIDGTNNYTMGKNAQDTYGNELIRVDHNVSEKERFYVRGNLTTLQRPENVRQQGTVGENFYRFNRGISADNIYMVSPSFFIDSRFTLTRFYFGYTPYQDGWDLASEGFSPQFINSIKQLDTRALKFPRIAPAGYSVIGGGGSDNSNNGDTQTTYNTYEAAINVTNVVGQHTIRSGGAWRVYQRNTFDLGSSSGALNFGTTYTNGPFNNSASAPIGQGFASFLYGIPSGGSLPINADYAEQTKYWAFYSQDDWKVNTKLTLTLGLRYELPSPMTERYNRSVRAFDAAASLPIASQALANYAKNPIPQVPVSQFKVAGGLTFAAVNGQPRELWNYSKKEFMPRIGFAYSLRPTTILRGGYGIYFEPLGVVNLNVNQSGFSSSTALNPSLDNGQTYIASLANPFPGGFNRPVGAAAGASTFLGQGVSFFNPGTTNPYMQRFQFAVQQQLPGRALLEVSYVGNRGTRLRISQDLNPVPRQYLSTLAVRDQATINLLGSQVANPFYPMLPGTSLASTTVSLSQLLRPYPQFTGVSAVMNAGMSWYHGVQVRAEKRLSAGLSAQYSFTMSKFMQATSYLNPTDPAPEHVVSDLDHTYRSVVSWIYELPFGRGKLLGAGAPTALSRIISGWQIQGVYTNQTGRPLSFGNALLNPGMTMADVVLPKDQRSIGAWFNTGAFNRVSAQQLGSNIVTMSSYINQVRAPSVNNWDMSAIKNTRIKERLNVQFSAQFINALNHAQFQAPNTSPTSTAFGRLTGTFSWQRIIEFGMKLAF